MCGMIIACTVLKARAPQRPDEQADFIFTSSPSPQAAAGGSIRAVSRLGQNEKSLSGSGGKSMYRSIRFVWIDSQHEHLIEEEFVGVPVSLCVNSVQGFSITCFIGQ